MARIRTVKPEFWEDETIGLLTRDARLLFIATFNLADDEGILRWTPEFIKASVFMYDDDVTTADADGFMEELVQYELLFPYKGGKSLQRLALIVNFRRHQVINRPQPSKFPFPSLQSTEVRTMYARRDHWTCHLCNQPIQESAIDRWDRHAPTNDHLIPQAKGGSDAPSNIRTAHSACNSGRRDRDLPPDHDFYREVNHSVNDSLNDSVNDHATSVNHSLLEVEQGREQGTGNIGAHTSSKNGQLVPIKPTAPDKPARSRDDLWDALEQALGPAATTTERQIRGKTRRQLAETGATPEQIASRCREYRTRFPGMALTDSALCKHWSSLAHRTEPVPQMSPSTQALLRVAEGTS